MNLVLDGRLQGSGEKQNNIDVRIAPAPVDPDDPAFDLAADAAQDKLDVLQFQARGEFLRKPGELAGHARDAYVEYFAGIMRPAGNDVKGIDFRIADAPDKAAFAPRLVRFQRLEDDVLAFFQVCFQPDETAGDAEVHEILFGKGLAPVEIGEDADTGFLGGGVGDDFPY